MRIFPHEIKRANKRKKKKQISRSYLLKCAESFNSLLPNKIPNISEFEILYHTATQRIEQHPGMVAEPIKKNNKNSIVMTENFVYHNRT